MWVPDSPETCSSGIILSPAWVLVQLLTNCANIHTSTHPQGQTTHRYSILIILKLLKSLKVTKLRAGGKDGGFRGFDLGWMDRWTYNWWFWTNYCNSAKALK